MLNSKIKTEVKLSDRKVAEYFKYCGSISNSSKMPKKIKEYLFFLVKKTIADTINMVSNITLTINKVSG